MFSLLIPIGFNQIRGLTPRTYESYLILESRINLLFFFLSFFFFKKREKKGGEKQSLSRNIWENPSFSGLFVGIPLEGHGKAGIFGEMLYSLSLFYYTSTQGHPQ